MTLFSLKKKKKFLAHGDGDVDAQVAVLGEQLCDGRVEHQAVAVHDGRGNALVDGAWRGLPGQAAPVPVELQPVGKVLGLLASTDKLHDGEELLVAVVFLLLLQHQHEVEAEARLHHDPVNGAGEVDVRGQEHNVLPLQTQRTSSLMLHNQNNMCPVKTQCSLSWLRCRSRIFPSSLKC